MAYLTLMLTYVGVVLDSFVSKLNHLFTIMDEYLQIRSRGDNKCIHRKIHSNINHVIDQGVLHYMSNN